MAPNGRRRKQPSSLECGSRCEAVGGFRHPPKPSVSLADAERTTLTSTVAAPTLTHYYLTALLRDHQDPNADVQKCKIMEEINKEFKDQAGHALRASGGGEAQGQGRDRVQDRRHLPGRQARNCACPCGCIAAHDTYCTCCDMPFCFQCLGCKNVGEHDVGVGICNSYLRHTVDASTDFSTHTCNVTAPMMSSAPNQVHRLLESTPYVCLRASAPVSRLGCIR